MAIVLGIAVTVAGLLEIDLGGSTVSSSIIVVVLSAAFLGPAYAVLFAALAEVAAAVRTNTRVYAFASNLLAATVPALAAAEIVRALVDGRPDGSLVFYLAVGAAGMVNIGLNFAIAAAYSVVLNSRSAAQPRKR